MAVKPIPDGFHTLTPYIVVRGVDVLIEFLKAAFDAKETIRTQLPGGSIMHAQVTIGDSVVMMGEAPPDFHPLPGSLYMYVEDTDAVYQRALQAGGVSVMERADQFYGDRNAGVKDPAGNFWWIATHIEDMSDEELQRRAEKFRKG